jgi:hypothetical protein
MTKRIALFIGFLILLIGCSTQSITEQHSNGLGITRESARDAFPSSFTESLIEETNKPPLLVAISKNRLVRIQLTGPPDDLSHIVIWAMSDSMDDSALKYENLLYTKRVLKVAFPDWQEADSWLDKNITEAVVIGPVKTIRGKRQIYLEANKTFLLLEINPVGVTPMAEKKARP